MSELSIGHCIDGFRIDSLLYAGAMAQIFEVSYADGRPAPFAMVMKSLKLSQGDGGENVTSFEVELQMLEALHGEYIPRFVAASDLTAPALYMVLEHITGQTLQKWMDDNASVPLEEKLSDICSIMSGVAEAVHGIHEQNACHLDLKPANIMVTPESRVVLLDFGLSFHGDYPDLLAEEFRQAVGSPAWISPEQVVGVRGDPRSDVFAIGVILYELACGELPFGAPETSGGMRNRLWMSPKPPRAINPSVPKWLQEIIMNCLQPKADDRYSSAALLAFDLRNPSQVNVTDRGEQLTGTSLLQKLKRFFWSAGIEYTPSALPRRTIKEVPIVMVAIPSRSNVDDVVLWGLRRMAGRALGNRMGARLAVVTVLKSSMVSSTNDDFSETTMHRQLISKMQRWADGIDVRGHQISFHVLDSDDIPGAILCFASENHVDLIIMGANSSKRVGSRIIARGALRVASEANCTVTLVREQLPFPKLSQLAETYQEPIS